MEYLRRFSNWIGICRTFICKVDLPLKDAPELWASSAPQHSVQAIRKASAPGSTLGAPPGAENKNENNAHGTGTLTWEVQPHCRACRAEAWHLVLPKVCMWTEQSVLVDRCIWGRAGVPLHCYFSIPKALSSQGLQNRIIPPLSKAGYFCLRGLQMNPGNPNKNLV